MASYVPQFHRIVARGSHFGLSPYYVLLGFIFSTTHLANILLLSSYRYPVLECIADGDLEGAAAFGALLGLVQVVLQWLCSMMLLVASLGTTPCFGELAERS